MRIALIATSAAAVFAVPLAVDLAAPQMTPAQFVEAVRCTAYQAAIDPAADLSAAKMQLNAEARRQPAEAAAQAYAESRAIARQAVISESGAGGAIIEAELSAACIEQLIARAAGADAA